MPRIEQCSSVLSSHGHVDFTNPSDEALEHLSNTCERATFGLNQDDVFDESYRKAGKLDAAHFATKLDVERSGLMDFVRFNLLQGEASGRSIKAELYKLNVYGEFTVLRCTVCPVNNCKSQGRTRSSNLTRTLREA